MGKNKEAGRSKNRASSSSLSASLLPYGASNIGFGGYLGSSRIESPTTSDEAKPSAAADGEIAQHIKRLGRKDPTTKLKALAALSAIVKQKSEEDIAQIIPLWAFEYKRLLNDYNREVRRATHETMINIVITVRRSLAPHLKSLMGPWWVSQFDEIHEVSQSARRSFEAAFPASERRLDALTLCSNEIVLYIDDNLKLVPQALSDKATPIDELEDIYHRVLSSSLLAIATLIDILVEVKADKADASREPKGAVKARMTAISSLERLFSDHKYFSEFLKSKNFRVRSAAYSVVVSMMRHMPDAIKEVNLKEFSASVLGSIHEKDPSCHSSMWDMILVFSKKFPDCWSYVNIQKNFINMLLLFLRNGCYGSQKISYPNLILFLDFLPPKIVAGERFVIRFFESLWAGRNPFHSNSQDQEAFFKTFQECLLWSLFKAARYTAEEHNFQVSLVDDVLIKLMWQDFLLVVSENDQERDLSKKSNILTGDVNYTDSSLQRKHCMDYPIHYVNNLGNSLIDILSILNLKDDSLFIVFCSEFLEGCMKIFENESQEQKFSQHVERLVKFFLLLDQHASGENQRWALHFLAKPFVRKTFSLIKFLDSPGGVRLLSIVIKIFGFKPTFMNNLPLSKEQTEKEMIEECTNDSEPVHFLHFFKDDIIPWCLKGLSSSSNERLDLLIASLDQEFFHEQWNSILLYSMPASMIEKWTLDADQIYLLAMLMEKTRASLISKKALNTSLTDASLAEHWRHELLDNAAIFVARLCPPGVYNARFLCSLIGGSSADHMICFLSEDATALVLEAALKNLLLVLSTSSYSWVKAACSTLQSIGCRNFVLSDELPLASLVEMAQFSFEILDGCIYVLSKLEKEHNLISSILAAVFIIEWESQMASQMFSAAGCVSEMENKIGFGDLQIISNSRCSLGATAKGFRCKMNTNLWRSLSTDNILFVRGVLTETIRSVIFEVNHLLHDEIPSLCCSWVLEILGNICSNHAEVQTMLDLLFAEHKNWPVWVAPDFRTDKRSATFICKTDVNELQYHQFIAFVEKLLCNLGFGKVILGSPSEVQSLREMLAPNSVAFSRTWLAAEMICSWDWGAGSVLLSFLPMFNDYAKTVTNFEEDNIVSSLINILIDGAILHGTDNPFSFPNAWTVSVDDIESIQGPFLRALVSVLWSLIVKETIWTRSDATVFFENVVDRLVIGTSINCSCLRILPFILNVVSSGIRRKQTAESSPIDSISSGSFSSNIVGWIQKVVSSPSLVFHQPEEKDLEQWIQVITSCYPLSLEGCGRSFRVAAIGDIDHSEKVWLLSLFRKQRVGSSASVPASEMASILFNTEMPYSKSILSMLSKLTAVSVGYCWQEFDEEDWDFVLSQLQFLIRLSVPMVEENTEKVDEIVNSGATVEAVVKNLEYAIQDVDSLLINICCTALIALSLISEVSCASPKERNSSQHVPSEKCSEQKDRILEDVLRIFFATGAAEAISRSLNKEVALVVTKNRFRQSNFWDLVASCAVSSPLHVKSSAVQAMELWGLSVGAVSSLFALLFSFEPISSLQFAAYYFLSSDPLIQISLIKENANTEIEERHLDSNLSNEIVVVPDQPLSLRDELTSIIENPSSQLLEMDLLGNHRVNYFLGWALLLSYIQSLPSSSPARERLIEHLQDSISSIVLDCIFQHIPLKSSFLQYLKKKDVALPLEVSKAANAATCAINTSSLLFAVEPLWPVRMEQMATFAGSIYGLMIRHLPAYVRDWFTRLRDRSLSAAIESFTKAWCSPPLIADEFAQIKEVVVADEDFSITVNKSAYEVIATYKKEETGMDLVIRLPICYPLRLVDVSCTRSLGISEVKQRKWLLSLTTFVRNQNGALAEAISTWKSNLNKEFQGVEECRICFSIIHTSNHSLPRLPCKTCKNKFHSACLYKWFSTSQKSVCPLCQMPF